MLQVNSFTLHWSLGLWGHHRHEGKKRNPCFPRLPSLCSYSLSQQWCNSGADVPAHTQKDRQLYGKQLFLSCTDSHNCGLNIKLHSNKRTTQKQEEHGCLKNKIKAKKRFKLIWTDCTKPLLYVLFSLFVNESCHCAQQSGNVWRWAQLQSGSPSLSLFPSVFSPCPSPTPHTHTHQHLT